MQRPLSQSLKCPPGWLSAGLALLLLGVAAAGARGAWAQTVQVGARSYALVDDLLAADGELLPRRRLVHELRLFAQRPLRDQDRLTLRLVSALRIDGDYGLENAQGEQLVQPLHRDLLLPYGYLELDGLGGGAATLRLGRVLRSEGPALLLLDGAQLSLRGPVGLRAEAFGGWLARRGLGTAAPDVAGPVAGLLDSEEATTLGGSLGLQGEGPVRGQVGLRQDQAEGQILRRQLDLGLRLQPRPWLGAEASWQRELISARDEWIGLRLEGGPWAQVRPHLLFEQRAPAFELGSLFWVFASEPSRSLAAGFDLRRGPLRLTLDWERLCRDAACGRSIESLGRDLPEVGDALQARAGLDLGGASCFAQGGLEEQGPQTGRRSLSLGARWSSALAELELEGAARWLQLGEGEPVGRAGEQVWGLDLGAGLWLWERVRLQGLLQQARGPWRPWWARALLLLDLEVWR